MVGTMTLDPGGRDMGALTARLELSAPARILLAECPARSAAAHAASPRPMSALILPSTMTPRRCSIGIGSQST